MKNHIKKKRQNLSPDDIKKLGQTGKDEKDYRTFRYKHEAAPMILALTFFALFQTLIIVALISIGTTPIMIPAISTLVAGAASYPVYSGIKIEMASEGKVYLERKKMIREGREYRDRLYPHFNDETPQKTSDINHVPKSREQQLDLDNTILSQEKEPLYPKSVSREQQSRQGIAATTDPDKILPNQSPIWQDYLTSRDADANDIDMDYFDI